MNGEIFVRCVTAFLVALGLALIWRALMPAPSYSQEHPGHAQYHNDYQGWSSQRTGNCCNNEDCHPLEDHEWRNSDTGPQVRIADEWCPVKSEHFLTKGKSPDWNKAHACVSKPNEWTASRPACERLLCFTGTAGG